GSWRGWFEHGSIVISSLARLQFSSTFSRTERRACHAEKRYETRHFPRIKAYRSLCRPRVSGCRLTPDQVLLEKRRPDNRPQLLPTRKSLALGRAASALKEDLLF